MHFATLLLYLAPKSSAPSASVAKVARSAEVPAAHGQISARTRLCAKGAGNQGEITPNFLAFLTFLMLFQTQIFLGPSPGRPAGASTEERRAGGFLLIATSLAPRTVYRATRFCLRGWPLRGGRKEKIPTLGPPIGGAEEVFYIKKSSRPASLSPPVSIPPAL